MVKTSKYLITLKANFFDTCGYTCDLIKVFKCKTDFVTFEMEIETLFSLDKMINETYKKEFGFKIDTLEAAFEFDCEIKLSEDEKTIYFLMPANCCN